MTSNVRIRFAPSPTGEPHIGSVRTVVFDYLFAKHFNGKMILRVEDTDQKRYVPGSVRALLEGLQWLGIEFDEGPSRQELAQINQDWEDAPEMGGPYGPYIQSLRRDIYTQAADELVARSAAYRCDCAPERLEALRKEQSANKQPIGYDRHCRDKKPGEVDPGQPHVVRLRTPLEGLISFHDLVKGDVTFDLRMVDDAVMLKSDGLPTYHLAVVVDDHGMQISHAIRADEWLPSTPKHILLYQALGWERPEFAHVPDVLAADGKKLSKRHGATSISEFRKMGYVPDALLNFLAFLGWAPGEGEEQEIFSRQELAQRFSMEHVNKAGAVFSYDKLDWMNGEYIRKMPPDRLAELVTPYLAAGLGLSEEDIRASGKVPDLIPLIRERMKRLMDSAQLCDLFFKDFQPPQAAALVGKKMDAASSLAALRRVIATLENVPPSGWTEHAMEPPMRALTEELGLKTGQLFGIVRVAVTGKEVAPPLFGTMIVLGREKVMERLRVAEAQLAGVAS